MFALFALFVLHLWMLGHKMRAAFLVGVIGCLCGVFVATLMDSIGVFVMDVVLGYMYLRNWFIWEEPENTGIRLAEHTRPEVYDDEV